MAEIERAISSVERSLAEDTKVALKENVFKPVEVALAMLPPSGRLNYP